MAVPDNRRAYCQVNRFQADDLTRISYPYATKASDTHPRLLLMPLGWLETDRLGHGQLNDPLEEMRNTRTVEVMIQGGEVTDCHSLVSNQASN